MPTPRTDRPGLAGAAIQRHPFGFIWQREVKAAFHGSSWPAGTPTPAGVARQLRERPAFGEVGGWGWLDTNAGH
jgi:hypothetical protein